MDAVSKALAAVSARTKDVAVNMNAQELANAFWALGKLAEVDGVGQKLVG